MRKREWRWLRPAALAVVCVGLACVPASDAQAKVRIGFDVGISLPSNVHVEVGNNYDAYYVGRVYYGPARAWRRVYAFPVETPSGIIYTPYIYDGGVVVFHDYIPGPVEGYSRFVREGRGRYEVDWYHDRGWHRRHDHGRGRGRGHGHR
jgi:hypothetical protein